MNKMKCATLIILGLITLPPHVSAVDSGMAKTEWSEVRSSPFLDFVASITSLKVFLDKYDNLPPGTNEPERRNTLNNVRMMARVLYDEQRKYVQLFPGPRLPSIALAISQPLYDEVQTKEFQKKLKTIVPNFEQGNVDFLQRSYFEQMDIDHLQKLYALYATLPLPSRQQLSQYRAAWGSAGWGIPYNDR
jgi:hypothetical protein